MADPRPDGGRRLEYGAGSAAIRDAALALATERGISAVTLRAVADRAGVSHSLVRHHLGTRDGLIAEVVDAAMASTSYLAPSPDEPLSQRIDRTKGELRIQYDMLLEAAATATIERAYSGYRTEVTTWLASRGIPPEPATVDLVVAVLDGLSLLRIARGDRHDVDAAFALLERLLDGLRATEASVTVEGGVEG